MSPSWANLGYLIWDIASLIIPFVPGSYIKKAGQLAISVASKLDDFADGSKFLTGTYKQLKKLFKRIKDIEIHHIIEKRFSLLFDCDKGEFLSIPLASELHQIITNRWRNLHKINDVFKFFAYGADYSRITYDVMELAIYNVYGDMPQLLEEALEWLSKHWKGR